MVEVLRKELTTVERTRAAAAAQLEAYDSYNIQSLYRDRSCFAPEGGVFEDNCLALVSGKTNVLLWGDSLAAHYYPGLSKTADPQAVHLLQANQPECMPTLNAAAQGKASCRSFAEQMDAFFRDRKPDLVIMSAHWIQYGRPQWFDSTIADIKQTILRLNETGVPVVLFGPSVQFRSRLPSMLMRAHLRHVDARPQDFVLPDIFLLDQKMKAALPAREGFAYISVVDAVCPERQCPLTIEAGVPLAWDAMHLTAEGSVYVAVRLKTMIHFKK